MSWLTKIAMSAQDIRAKIAEGEWLYLKFVRVNGKYLFGDANQMGITHKGMVGDEKIVPESAGYLKVNPDGFIIEGFSIGYKIGPDEKDEDNLESILGIPAKSPW